VAGIDACGIAEGIQQVVLPDIFRLSAAGRLQMEAHTGPLTNIEEARTMQVPGWLRLVITI